MKRTVTVLGVPLDLGQGRRGVDMGPSAIRYANLQDRIQSLGIEVIDLSNVIVPTPESHVVHLEKLKYLPEIVSVSKEVAAKVSAELEVGRFPIILGGDHSISIGSIAGVAKAIPKIGVIWFDAHGDMNTQDTTPSGNIHGMPLAVSLGIGHPELTDVFGFCPKIQAKNVVLVGARSIDKDERELIKQAGIKVFSMHEIDKIGMSAVMEEAIRIASDGTDGVHLSLDVDAFDPREAPGVGTPVSGGVTYREGHLAMEILAAANVLRSVDVVEVNPILDSENRTATLAVDMICSLLGETVL